MNFDGGRVKIEVRETLFCVFAGKFHRPVGPIFFKGDDVSFFPIKILLIWKIPLNSRSIRLDQHETTFTGKNPRRNNLDITFSAEFSVFSAVAQWSERLLGLQVVRVQGSTKPNLIWLFLFVCFLLFSSLGMFSLNSTAGPSFELHEVLWYTFFWVIRYDPVITRYG